MLNGQGTAVVSRRRFLRFAAAGIAWMAATPLVATMTAAPAQAAQVWKAFEFDTNRDVDIVIHRARNPRRLHITVHKNGEVADVFPRADPRTLDDLNCRHFAVRYVDPPGA